MDIIEYTPNELGFIQCEVLSDCQISVEANGKNINKEEIINIIKYIVDNLTKIKEIIVTIDIYNCEFVDKIRCENKDIFLERLALSSIHITNNRLIEVVLDNEQFMFGHYICGEFHWNLEFNTSYIC